MKKLLLVTLLVWCSPALPVSAQQFNVGIAPELSLPTGSSANRSTVGAGMGVKVEVIVAERFGLTTNLGYNLFISKRYFGKRAQNLSAFPLKLGLKYYTKPKFYFEGQAGSALNTSTGNKSSFVWAVGMGSYADISRNAGHRLNFGLRYESWADPSVTVVKKSSFDFVSVKLIYEWPL